MAFNDGSIPIPTQPVDMGKELQKKSSGREEIKVLILFMILAVVVSWGAFIAVSILRTFSADIFSKVENSGISIESLKSFRAFRRIRIAGSLAIGVLIAIGLLSRGVTTLLMSILWGVVNLVTLLVVIRFFINTGKREKTRAMDVIAVIVSIFSMVTTLFIPYELIHKFYLPKYWIPSTHNSISIWAMIPTIVWTVFLVIYFIVAVISAICKHDNSVTKPGTEG